MFYYLNVNLNLSSLFLIGNIISLIARELSVRSVRVWGLEWVLFIIVMHPRQVDEPVKSMFGLLRRRNLRKSSIS